MTWNHTKEKYMESWNNNEYNIVIKLYQTNRANWEVSLGQGSYGSYLLIKTKGFPSKPMAKKQVEKLLKKYKNGWM